MKAVVLCAGYGTRLGDLTRETPKPLLPLQGRPLLEYTLAHLHRHGVRQVGINLHFEAAQVRRTLGDGARFGLEIEYRHEPTLLGTAGGVRGFADWLGEAEPFFVLYGDILTDQDLGALGRAHRQYGAAATLLLHQRAGSNSLVRREADGSITGFVERPTEEERRASPFPWVNSGIHVLEPAVLRSIPPGQPHDFPRHVFPGLVAAGGLFGHPLEGYRCAIDSPARYAEAEAAVVEGAYRSPFRSSR
jgi:mannose-1-phosphate guanylyltransferase/phosphomannomutase